MKQAIQTSYYTIYKSNDIILLTKSFKYYLNEVRCKYDE